MKRISQKIERLSPPAWTVLAIALIAVPVVGSLAEGPWLWLANILSALAGGLFGGGGAWRYRVARLPLEVAPAAVVQREGAAEVYRFRVRLGRGRPMRSPHAELSWEAHGTREDVPLLLDHAEVLLGPWTLVVRDEAGRYRGPGVFHLAVQAMEGDATHRVQASWERSALVEGAFAPAVERSGRSITWTEPWARVVPVEGL